MNTRIIASDLEGTLTTGATWRGIADYLTSIGQEEAYRRVYRKYFLRALLYRMNLNDGEKFKNDWMNDQFAAFSGWTLDQLSEMVDWVVENELWPKRRVSVIEELQSYVSDGHKVILTSGVWFPIVEGFSRKAGFTSTIGTPVEIVDGKVTGNVSGVPNTGTDKTSNIRAYLNGNTLYSAYGDTKPDISMLELAEKPVAVYPDKTLTSAAQKNGWRIINSE